MPKIPSLSKKIIEALAGLQGWLGGQKRSLKARRRTRDEALRQAQMALASAIRAREPWERIRPLAQALPNIDHELHLIGSPCPAALAMHHGMEAFKGLLDMGASMGKREGSLYNLAERACSIDAPEHLAILIERRAPMGQAIKIAAAFPGSKCLELLANRANPWTLTNELHLLAAKLGGNAQNAKTLVSNGARIETRKRSALVEALKQGNEPLARMLIELGADVRFTDSHNNSPLGACLSQFGDSQPHIVRSLLALGADPEAPSSHLFYGGFAKASPLYICVQSGAATCAQMLLEAGARLEKRTFEKARAMADRSHRSLHIHRMFESLEEKSAIMEAASDAPGEAAAQGARGKRL